MYARQIQLVEAQSLDRLAAVRELFLEYAASLPFSLDFQNFDLELAQLPGQYAPPTGRLFLSLCDQLPAGCVALRSLGGTICEMKRLFVRPAFRRQGLGRELALTVIAEARRLHYDKMRLDTISSMNEAIALYQSLGFKPIPPYCSNPLPEASYFELDLQVKLTAVD